MVDRQEVSGVIGKIGEGNLRGTNYLLYVSHKDVMDSLGYSQ